MKSQEAEEKKKYGAPKKNELGRGNTLVLNDLEALESDDEDDSLNKPNAENEPDEESNSNSESDDEDDCTPHSMNGDETVVTSGGITSLKNILGEFTQLLHFNSYLFQKYKVQR